MKQAWFTLAVVLAACGDGGSEGASGGSAGSAASGGSGGAGGSGGTAPDGADRIGAFSLPQLVVLFDENQSTANPRRYQIASDRTAFSLAIGFAADLDGDGFDAVSFLDVRSGAFHLDHDGDAARLESVEEVRPFAAPSTELREWPLAGDVDGDGRDDLGTFDLTSGALRIEQSGGGELTLSFSESAVIPLLGDWDGDGIDSFGRYDPATGLFELSDDNQSFPPGFTLDVAPSATVLAVAGDFDGDGRDSVGVYDLSSGRYSLTSSNAGGEPELVVDLPAGSIPWFPVVGRWKPAPPPGAELGFEWETSNAAEQGIDAAQLEAALASADAIPSVFSVLVARNGTLVAERYFHGASRSFASNVKSVSKSVLSALTAIAIEDGLLAEDATVGDFFSGLPAEKQTISVGHLVTMTAGLRWQESDASFVPWLASSDWSRFPLDEPLDSAPGSTFSYSTGLTHVMSTILTELTAAPLPQFANAKLFDPLGMKLVRWDRDPSGTHLGGAELYIVPRDVARFGQLMLENGTLDGKLVLSAQAVTNLTSELLPASEVDGTNGYGAWWWHRSFAGHASCFAWGHGGTFLFLFRDLNALVVVTSNPDVGYAESGANGNAVFALLEQQVLPAFSE